jgi:CheY-like chemotaxis protein
VLAIHADPLCATPFPVVTPPPFPEALADMPTILLVDDSATQRRLIHLILQESGAWNILQATDGVAALEVMERTVPDLVLTDIYMPQMDGLGLVEQVRERFPQVPVVLMTGRGSEQLAVDALRVGAADYVSKVTIKETLGGVLERVLEHARAEVGKLRLLSGMKWRVTSFELENDASLISPLLAGFRDDLMTLGVCDQHDATRIGIALEEALLNAMYHGNLEVSSDLKREGEEPFHRLARERRGQAPYAQRRVRVSARLTRKKATFLIADQGPGFDVSKLPDPTDPANLEMPSGRGLLLMRLFMDEVRYNSTGNQITLVKHRTAAQRGDTA